ncbi:MAG TPA: VOC family protein [Anaerolineales bacterium]|nr:VOC family protein [Anaerolineales bacterium]
MAIDLKRIGQVSLTVDDVDVAERFYQDTLGLRKLYRFGDLVFFDCAGVRLFISKPETGSFSPASSVLYFRTPDIRVAVHEMTAKGVSFIDEPHVVAEMADHDLWMAFFKDPAGNTLALMHEAPKN